MATVNLHEISKSFGRTRVLNGVSLFIPAGKFVSLLGPSGCGKTTLLRIVAGLESATSGSVLIGGQDATNLPPEQRNIAMVFQSYALLPHLSVRENVRFPLRMRHLGGRDEQEDRVRKALETVQLAHLGERKPRELSGGQQQRVALARAIVSNPQVLLLDEPLSNLDARLREDMQVELIELQRKLGLTTIFVTHDQEEALSLSDNVVLLNGGRVEQEGTPKDIYAAPRTSFAASFLGSTNLVDVDIQVDSTSIVHLPDGQFFRLAASIGSPGKRRMMVRQEDINLYTPGTPLPLDETVQAVVETRVFLGARCRYVLRIGPIRLRCLTAANQLFEPGADVSIHLRPDQIRLLNAEETANHS